MDIKIKPAKLRERQTVISLTPGELIELPDSIGYRITCLSGAVLVHCSTRDIECEVRRGETLAIECAGNTTLRTDTLAVIQVIENPSLRLGLGRLPSIAVNVTHVPS